MDGFIKLSFGLCIVLAVLMWASQSCKKPETCYDCKAYYNNKHPDNNQGELATQEQRCSDALVIDFYNGWNHPVDSLGYYANCTLK